MSHSQEISVELLAATRGNENSKNGLITLKVLIPIYIWTETLTHRTLARNASSARAMSNTRYVDMGFYMPNQFYGIGTGMVSSDTPIIFQEEARNIYVSAWVNAVEASERLTNLGVCKEQANRIIPPIKMIMGVITGTEKAWQSFLSLRLNPDADKAMQLFAKKVSTMIDNIYFNISPVHKPLCDRDDRESLLEGVARLARVSYARSAKGKNDLDLAKKLAENKHLSPFEHIGFYTKLPAKNVFTTFPEDLDENNRGWVTFRHFIEQGQDIFYE